MYYLLPPHQLTDEIRDTAVADHFPQHTDASGQVWLVVETMRPYQALTLAGAQPIAAENLNLGPADTST